MAHVRQFKSINKGNKRKRHPLAGRSIKYLSYRKTSKISCEKVTINYFIIFPTAVFPGHKICQLRNNNHRLRSGVARGECDNTLEGTLNFTGEEAQS